MEKTSHAPLNNELYEVYSLYKSDFIPIYDDLIIFIGDKPEHISIQLDNILSHIMVCFENIDDSIKQENIKKAKNHIIRATLDAYKICCHHIMMIIKSEISNKISNNNHNDDDDVILQYNKFLGMYRNARKNERDNMGINPYDSIIKYKEAYECGLDIIKKFSIPNIIVPKVIHKS